MFSGRKEKFLPMNLAAQAAPEPTLHPADAYKQTRLKTRDREQTALTALLNATDTDAEVRLQAQKQLAELVQNSEIELAAEAALLARGYEKALCVSRAGEAIVFVSGEIGAQDAALILEILEEASGLPRENIRVSGYAF